MKSPFPGLDPYLEARWSDVHQRLITYAALRQSDAPALLDLPALLDQCDQNGR